MDWLLEHHEEIRNLGLVAAAAIGLPLAIWRSFIAQKQTRIATDNHLAETYTKAIDQLGRSENEIRLGGLYALEKIALTNHRYHGQIMEVLCAFVRLHAPLEEQKDKKPPPIETEESHEKDKQSPKLIVQTALTIIGRRNLASEKISRIINNLYSKLSSLIISPLYKKFKTLWLLNYLSYTSKRTVTIDLKYADLSKATLFDANLSGASLVNASLESAIIGLGNLSRANLSRANLTKATLIRTNLSEADLSGADFQETTLAGVDLSSTNITQEQLQAAIIIGKNIFPDGIDEEALTFEEEEENETL